MTPISDIHQIVRNVLQAHGKLHVDAQTLDVHASLYDVGMTSHASVNVMLGVESHFDIEFPDALLHRQTFQSIDNISQALHSLGA